jgi:hypothetical protein
MNVTSSSYLKIYFSETSVLTRPTLRTIPEDGILHSCREDGCLIYTDSLAIKVRVKVILRPTVIRRVYLCVGLSFLVHDQIFPFFLSLNLKIS